MKSFVAVLIIFAVLLTLVTLNSLYVSKTFSKISDICDGIASGSEQAGEINTVLRIWSKSQRILNFSIEADEIERMNDLMESLRAAHLTDNSYDISKYCRLISELSKELAEYEKISLDSIF